MQYQQDILNKHNSIIELYYIAAEKSDQNREKENKVATKIQSWYRMHVKKILYRKIRYNTIFMQKFARGYLARMLMKRNSDSRYNERNYKYFSYQATQIQRYFKGYHYRKYYLNWATRKEYLNFLKHKNETFLEELKKVEQEEAEQLKYRQEHLARTEFESLARNLHHLTSTKSISGIYNRPFGNRDVVFDMDIESHLKIVFHSNFEWEKSKQMSRYTKSKKLSMTTKLKPLK